MSDRNIMAGLVTDDQTIGAVLLTDEQAIDIGINPAVYVGPQGEQGIQGKQGIQGIQGNPGPINALLVGERDYGYDENGASDLTPLVQQLAPPVTAKSPIATLPGLIDGLPLNPILSVLAALTGTGEISPDNRYELNGVTGAGVKRTGRNLVPTGESVTIAGITYTVNPDGSITANGTATNWASIVFAGSVNDLTTVFTLSPGTYILKGTGNANMHMQLRIPGNNVWKGAMVDDLVFTITQPQKITRIFAQCPAGSTFDNFTFYPQLTFGRTAHPYEPYTGQDYEVPFGREVIGFAHAPAEVRLDGKPSKSTGRKVTFNGTEAWSLSGVTGVDGVKIFIRPISGAKNYGASVIGAGILCDAYKAVQPSSIGSLAVNQCFIRTTSDDARTDAYFAAPYDTVDEFKAALAAAPITVFYELETPDEFTLDPATLPSIVSLAGVNHVYSDVGDTEASGYMTAGAAYQAQQDEIDELRAALELLLPQGG